MKVINSDMIESLSSIKIKAISYMENCDIVLKYVEKPLQTINILLESGKYSDYQTQLENIKKGLIGEFTKTKAIELGKLLLIEIISNKEKTLLDDHQNIVSVVNNITEVISGTNNIINTTCDIAILTDRKNKAISTIINTEYANSKIESVLTNSDLGGLDNEDFLIRLITLLSNNDTMLDTASTLDYLKLHNTHITLLDSAITDASMLTKTNIINSLKIDLSDYTGVVDLNNILTKISNQPKTDNKYIVYVMDLISNLSAVINTQNKNIKEYNNIVMSINPKDLFTKYIEYFRNEILKKYLNGEITKDEFKTSKSIIINLITNILIIESNLIFVLLKLAIPLAVRNDLIIETHTVLDKLTMAMIPGNNIKRVYGGE